MEKNRFNFDDEVLTAFGGDGGGGGGGGSCGPSSCSSGAGSTSGGEDCVGANIGIASLTACTSSSGISVGTSVMGVGLSQNSKGETLASMSTPTPGIQANLSQTSPTTSEFSITAGISKNGATGSTTLFSTDVTVTPSGRAAAESAWSNSNEFSGALSSGSGASSLSRAAPIAVRWSGGKVICTELYRNGHIDYKVWAADIQYSQKYFSEQTMRGYHYWGIPFVKLMRKSKLISKLVKHPTSWFAEDIAYRMGVLSKPNLKGWIIREVIFKPACYVIGFFAEQKDWKSLWNTQLTKS